MIYLEIISLSGVWCYSVGRGVASLDDVRAH